MPQSLGCSASPQPRALARVAQLSRYLLVQYQELSHPNQATGCPFWSRLCCVDKKSLDAAAGRNVSYTTANESSKPKFGVVSAKTDEMCAGLCVGLKTDRVRGKGLLGQLVSACNVQLNVTGCS